MNTTARAIIDFQEGMSIEDACESNGASQDEVEKLLRGGASKISRAIKEIVQPKIRKNAKSTKATASSTRGNECMAHHQGQCA